MKMLFYINNSYIIDQQKEAIFFEIWVNQKKSLKCPNLGDIVRN